ncbi:hypothetical protein DES38_10488 [Streptohalobacillus salinus]|uniref:Uncharacterized protein n=1 Tax=Streptohalobacillus salinus TaxID=621096 RepID=A0A2V3WDU3_9BACI|nr:hypothetical protein [Streptohalobacillus salinus]PXW91656.1 hypothetical protein DES38_10488 [Streptohalobacillus salinus]
MLSQKSADGFLLLEWLINLSLLSVILSATIPYLYQLKLEMHENRNELAMTQYVYSQLQEETGSGFPKEIEQLYLNTSVNIAYSQEQTFLKAVASYVNHSEKTIVIDVYYAP